MQGRTLFPSLCRDGVTSATMVNSPDPAVAQRAAIVLQARMASTRLPGKALADVNGRPILEHCIERLRATSMLPIVVATTERKDDDALAEAASHLGVEVVRGPDADVLSRFVLVVRRLELTALIRATADNPAVNAIWCP